MKKLALGLALMGVVGSGLGDHITKLYNNSDDVMVFGYEVIDWSMDGWGNYSPMKYSKPVLPHTYILLNLKDYQDLHNTHQLAMIFSVDVTTSLGTRFRKDFNKTNNKIEPSDCVSNSDNLSSLIFNTFDQQKDVSCQKAIGLS